MEQPNIVHKMNDVKPCFKRLEIKVKKILE